MPLQIKAAPVIFFAAAIFVGCGGTHHVARAPTPPSSAVSDHVASVIGSLLTRPGNPIVIPAETDCHNLLTLPVRIASISSCVTASGGVGTVTATVEDYAHTQECDVWRRQGPSAVLQLQYTGDNTAGPTIQFRVSDLLGNHDPELIALQMAPGVAGVQAVDVIDETGSIVAHLTLGAGGQVTRSSDPPGLQAWSGLNALGSANEIIIGFQAAQWRILEAKLVPRSAIPSFPNGDGLA